MTVVEVAQICPRRENTPLINAKIRQREAGAIQYWQEEQTVYLNTRIVFHPCCFLLCKIDIFCLNQNNTANLWSFSPIVWVLLTTIKLLEMPKPIVQITSKNVRERWSYLRCSRSTWYGKSRWTHQRSLALSNQGRNQGILTQGINSSMSRYQRRLNCWTSWFKKTRRHSSPQRGVLIVNRHGREVHPVM